MQDGRGKRILELAQHANDNKKAKIIVQSVVTLKPQNLVEPLNLQMVTKCDANLIESPLPCLSTIPKNSQKDILDNQVTELKAIDSVQSLSYIEKTDVQNKIIEEAESSDVDPFECSDEDTNFDPNNEENCDTDEEIEESESKKNSRWNKANNAKWTRNISKKCRNLGQPYITKRWPKPARIPKFVDCTKCKFSCSEKFSDEDRRQLCSGYWQLEAYSRKKDFILKNVKSNTPQRQRFRNEGAKARTNSKEFYFLKNNIPTRVCQKFFLKTLSISNGPLNIAKKSESSGLYDGDDMRGWHTPSNKITEEEKKYIKNHIESFPLTESHFCRKSSQRKYLDASLSIAKMYSLYKELCQEISHIPKSLTTYKRVFCNEYNYSFFKPRKDQCALCMKYESANAEQKLALKISYNEHKKREADANESKKNDKERACNEPNFVTATFDLQSVLQIPSSDVSPLYYSRKLCAYNLTVYEGAPPNNAYCYTWTEVNGARGSLEIATCLYQCLNSLPYHVSEVSFFSDTCGGQNRNQNVLAMLYYFVHYGNTSVITIEQKFLESGHSMMECDSMHSAIEREKRYVAVYTLNDWINIFKMARSKRGPKKNDPYQVKELKYKDFFDFKALSQSILKNRAVNTNGEKVKWLQVKCFRIEKCNPGIVKYRYSHTGDYLSMNISGKGRRSISTISLNKAYTAMLPISAQKYNDLNKLCTTEVIPVEFHNWYHYQHRQLSKTEILSLA